MTACKLCSLLGNLPRDEALEANELLIGKSLSAAESARITSKHLGPVGTTTIKKHRKESHRDF